MPRFFVKTKLLNNTRVDFSAEQALQMQKVLRMKVGDKVEVFDNSNDFAIVELEKISKDYTYGKIIESDHRVEQSRVIIFQAYPKNPKSELIVQKCTELGVDAIVFFESDHSVVKTGELNEKKLNRLEKIAIEASEQCGRITVPVVSNEVMKLGELIPKLKEQYLEVKFSGFFYLDSEGKWLSKKDFDSDVEGYNAVFIGAEGGFSANEKSLFESHSFKKIKIAENILRCETAGITFLSQFNLVNNQN